MIVNISLLIGIFIPFELVFANDFYKTYYLESDKVCTHKLPFTTKLLTTGKDSAITIKENTYFNDLSGLNKFRCNFEVKTGHEPQFNGIFVVIQKMNLRQDPETKQCIDYVGLRAINKSSISQVFNLRSKSKKEFQKYCGNLSAKRDGDQHDSLHSGLSSQGFLSDNGETIQVEVFIAPIPTYDEELQLEITFTPYMSCRNSWSDYKECGSGKCIHKKAFNDGVVNCPFVGCSDEEYGCDIIFTTFHEDKWPSGMQTKVTLTAVTSIFCSFFLFLGCIWCFRYFELFCWSARTLLGHPVELSPMADPEPSPSAPPIDSASKDLPPAYETLFPESAPDGSIFFP